MTSSLYGHVVTNIILIYIFKITFLKACKFDVFQGYNVVFYYIIFTDSNKIIIPNFTNE